MTLAGDPPTNIKRELWDGPVNRGFDKSHGLDDLQLLVEKMVPVDMLEGRRHKVYPARDDCVLRVVRKMIRGLLYEHGLPSTVPDQAIRVDVLTFNVPTGIIDRMDFYDRDSDVVEYGYRVLNLEGVHTFWILTFFQTISFFAGVLTSNYYKEHE